MQLEFGSDTICKCFRIFALRCGWNLSQTQSGIVLKKFSMRCNWNLANAQFGIVLELFRLDAIRIWLGNNLNVP